MISAATGAMALVVVPLVADYGVGHLFAATILLGTNDSFGWFEPEPVSGVVAPTAPTGPGAGSNSPFSLRNTRWWINSADWIRNG